jgi:ATP-dependent Clp protease ATP-binding subunit ClpA
MFERFTDRARAVVMYAQEEARQLNHNYIGTEHILYGLCVDQEGMGARALAACGLDGEKVRAEIERRVGRGVEAPKGSIPFTPRAKKVLELALRQALKLGHNYIGTEHVLLGILAEGEGVAAQILMSATDVPTVVASAVGLTRVRDAVFDLMGRPPEALVGVEGRLAELSRKVRARIPGISAVTVGSAEDEIRKRLEAIEARLSVIEQLLREGRGEEEVS